MLNDWIWAGLLTLALWLEASGWSRLFVQAVFRSYADRQRVGLRLRLALGFMAMAQVYFALSLAGRGTPGLHLAGLLIGIGCNVLPKRQPARAAGWHLKAARAFSPLTWKRVWPWVVLPLCWAGLRILDALLPHASQAELSYTLLAPRLWAETGLQRLDPLNPLAALASVWEALSYHAFCVLKALGPVPLSGLVRGQLTAQLLHLTAGQILAGALLARLLEPIVRAGWNALAHADLSPNYRHRIGMASSVAVPASFFFAWIACGQSQSGAVASADWGAAMFVFAALGLALELPSPKGALLAGLCWGTAVAAYFPVVATASGLIAAVVMSDLVTFSRATWRQWPAWRRLAVLAAGAAAALVPWVTRNALATGAWFFPYSEIIGKNPGWIAEGFPVTPTIPPLSPATWVILALGLPALGVSLWRARGVIDWSGLRGLLAFALLGAALPSMLTGTPPDAATTAALAALALVGVELAVAVLRRSWAAEIGRYVPYAWLVVGLFAVSLPFHLLWQDLPQMFRPTETVLSQVVPHFDGKLWARRSLPKTSHVAWTFDTEFYYLDQPAASIRESSILHDTLVHGSNPATRVAALCDLGFDVLAWEDRAHGPETAGLGTWLRLNKSAVLHVTDDVTFFDLRCGKPAEPENASR